ncbi:synaptic vesicle glycoprotein 2B-like isoform X2 [Periplaneta americana]|uniref:synaptic vesicle glycoprotein 2B-like isoform X2 n=1 Tax=Periplaneta americana TaxID=6978 RepID=UPI0037E9066E
MVFDQQMDQQGEQSNGSILSAFLWGALADCVGRKNVIATTLAADAIITLICSLSQTFSLLAVFRFLNGFLSGAPASLIFAYLGEFHTHQNSNKNICYVGFFWTLAWMLLPGLAWLVIPQSWSYQVPGFTYNSWRIFVAMLAVPSTLGALILLCFPESPKYLLAVGKHQEALLVLSKMYTANTGNPPCEYSVKSLEIQGADNVNFPIADNNQMMHKKSILILWKTMWAQTSAIFLPPVLYNTALCSLLLFANMFGYYGLGLWLPEIFNRFEDYYKLHPSETVSVCELQQISSNINETIKYFPEIQNLTFENFDIKMNSSIAIQSSLTSKETSNQTVISTVATDGAICDGDEVNTRVFFNTLIIGAACLVGNILSGLLAGRVGVRVMPVCTMLLAGSCVFAIYFLRSSTQNLIVSCLFLSSIGTGNFVITSVVVDLFPTKIRAMAVCTSILAGRVGAMTSNIVFGELIDVDCSVPIFLMGTVCIVGGILGFFIPTKSVNKVS